MESDQAMSNEQALSRIAEAEQIIEDVLGNLAEDLGLQVQDVQLAINDATASGIFKFRVRIVAGGV